MLDVEGKNLDTFFAREDGVRYILSSAGDGYAVIEGVMGLYDGQGAANTEGSGYEIAAYTDTPIVLVMDASGMGRTVLSLIKGLLSDDERHLIRGVIFNRMSERFYERLRPVFEAEIGKIRDDVMLLGFIPKDKDLRIESRHLGLKLPEEIEDLQKKIAHAADLLCKHVDVEALLSIMESAKPKAVLQSGMPYPGEKTDRRAKNAATTFLQRQIHQPGNGTACGLPFPPNRSYQQQRLPTPTA